MKIVFKSFPDHLGRPGQEGGSLPKGASGAKDFAWTDWRITNGRGSSTDSEGRYDTTKDGVDVSIIAETWGISGRAGKWWYATFSKPHPNPKRHDENVTVHSDEEFKVNAKGLADMKKWVAEHFDEYKIRLDARVLAASKPPKRTRRTSAQKRQDNFVLYD